jgi:PAS domain S-box-containing protein
MFTRVRDFFSPPRFKDEEQNRIGRVLYIILVTLIAASLIVGLVDALSGTPSTFPVLLIGDCFLLVVLWLTRLGKLKAAALFLLMIMTAMVTALLVIGQGVHDIGIALYPVIIIIAALLLDRRDFIIVVGLIVFSLAVVVFGEIFGVIAPVNYVITTRPADFIIVATLFVLAAYAIRLMADDLQNSLRRARENESKLTQSNLELENRARELELSEARWRTVVENAPDTILSLLEDGTIIFSNQLDSQENDELKGKSVYDSLLPEDREQARRVVAEMFRTGKSITYESRVIDRKHDLRWYSIRLGSVCDPDGKVVNGIIIATDINDDKEGREALHASEEALRHSSEYLMALNKIGLALSTLQDLNGALRATLDAIKASLQLDVFYIILYDSATNQVLFPLLYDSGKIWDETGGELDDGTMAASVIHSGEPLLLNRTLEEIEVARKSKKQIGDTSKISASVMSVPMRYGQEIIGVISAHSYIMNAYSQSHLDLLIGAAHQVAIAIENARLYEAAQKELTERKRAEGEVRELNTELERRVLQRTVELEASNRELESFTYTVSHDLRAPVRGLHGFSQILLNDYSAVLPDEARNYLMRIEDNARLMGNLIDDLLAFSHLGRQQVKKVPVDAAAIARQAFDEAAAQEDRSRIRFSLQDIPVVQADAALLKQVFINLFSNAIKFSRLREVAVIEAGSESSERGIILFVRDNGAGFDMRHSGKLFGVFQRLHSYDQFEGTGVGLAIVRRIIERHGGSVWAEAELNKGAAFFFTLGK